MMVLCPKCAYGPYFIFVPIKNGVYVLIEVSFNIVLLMHYLYYVGVSLSGLFLREYFTSTHTGNESCAVSIRGDELVTFNDLDRSFTSGITISTPTSCKGTQVT